MPNDKMPKGVAVLIAEKMSKKESGDESKSDSGDKGKEMAQELLDAIEAKDASKVSKVLVSMHKVWCSDMDDE